MKHIKTFHVVSMGKPRMVHSDKWKKRPCVERYWATKDEILLQKGNFELPESNFRVVFYLPMPETWSKKKKENMNNKPHRQKPDVDNLGKFFMDCLSKKDEVVWDIRVTKLWSDKSQIDVYDIGDEK